jgi:hypothetical protein
MALLMNNLEERSLANDLKMGLQNEITIIEILNTTFDETFENTKDKYGDQYCQYDFEGDKGSCVELKSRRNTYSKYPTTIVPTSKVLEFNTNRQIFVFQFTDGYYYIIYEATKFNTFNTRMITTQRAGIVDKPKPHYEIPIKDLIRMNV